VKTQRNLAEIQKHLVRRLAPWAMVSPLVSCAVSVDDANIGKGGRGGVAGTAAGSSGTAGSTSGTGGFGGFGGSNGASGNGASGNGAGGNGAGGNGADGNGAGGSSGAGGGGRGGSGSGGTGGMGGGGGIGAVGGISGNSGSGGGGSGGGSGEGGAGGAGTGGVGGTTGSAGEAGTGGAGGSAGDATHPTKLPTATNCPTFRNGATIKIDRMNVVIYMAADAKSKPAPGGPLILYYHATLGTPGEVLNGFGQANISKVTAMGGVVAAFTSTACTGCATTDDFYWFVEDNKIQDTVVACAIQQANIDTRHIHALGWSAGALHSVYVGLSRSDYMASIVSYSGGLSPWPGQGAAQDPNNHVSALLTYGALDAVVVDFPTQSKAYYTQFQPKGYYTMMCNHGGGHMIDTRVAPQSLKFFMDHPYKVNPAPYAGAIPSVFPTYCKNAP
jgi:hypothetical protein